MKYRNYLPYAFHTDSIIQLHRKLLLLSDPDLEHIIRHHGDIRKGVSTAALTERVCIIIQSLDDFQLEELIVNYIFLLDLAANCTYALGWDLQFLEECNSKYGKYLKSFHEPTFTFLINYIGDLLYVGRRMQEHNAAIPLEQQPSNAIR